MADTPPSKEQISVLRWMAIFAGVALFLSENLNLGFQVWAKPVDSRVYWVIGAVAVGIDAPTMRRLLVAFFETFTRGK